MTSSNGNIFRVTGPLCGEFTGPGEFPTQRPVTRSFDVFLDLRLNKRLNKQSWGWWFETLSRPFWRHRNECSSRASIMAFNSSAIGLFVQPVEANKKRTNLHISGLCWGNRAVTDGFSPQRVGKAKTFPCHDHYQDRIVRNHLCPRIRWDKSAPGTALPSFCWYITAMVTSLTHYLLMLAWRGIGIGYHRFSLWVGANCLN